MVPTGVQDSCPLEPSYQTFVFHPRQTTAGAEQRCVLCAVSFTAGSPCLYCFSLECRAVKMLFRGCIQRHTITPSLWYHWERNTMSSTLWCWIVAHSRIPVGLGDICIGSIFVVASLVSLCSAGWSGTCCIDLVGHELIGIHLSASHSAGIKGVSHSLGIWSIELRLAMFS